MISKKLLGLAALTAAGAISPTAIAATSGSLASLNITVHDLVVNGLPATKTINLAGDEVTQVATCSGQVRKTIVGSGASAIVSTRSYDAAGRLLAQRDATGAGTDYTYDALGRNLTETDAAIAGKVRRYAHDAVGRLINSTDPLGIVTTYAYDLRDRKISESTPVASPSSLVSSPSSANEVRLIRYGYDARGNMTTLTDANGAVTTWGFDAAGRQVSKLYANGDARSMAYDAASRLVRLTDENGHDTTSIFDLAGRLLSKTFTADNTTDTYAYDTASRMTSVTKGRYAHTLTYGYDQAGRVATETHPDGTVLHLAYDAANRLANLSLASGSNGDPSTLYASPFTTAYSYNTTGLLATVTAGDYATRYDYRANGQLASTVDYRTVDPQADILRTDRTYDAGARLTEVANTAASGEQVGVRYTLAADDQRVEALEESGQKWQYGYDGLKQLVSAKKTDTATTVVPPLDQSYTYDPMGNRRAYTEQGKSIAYATNNANQYVSTSETSAGSPVQNSNVYDRNGNLLSDGVKNYVWDAENQLIAVSPVTPADGAAKVEYTYDWRMRRTGKKSYTYANGAWSLAKTSDFKYHEWNPIEEKVSTYSVSSSVPSVSSVVKNYVWGNDLSGNLHGAGGVGGLLSIKVVGSTNAQPSADNYFYAYDGNGNVRALVKADAANPASSGLVERYSYDGFGRELAGSTSLHTSALNAFRFSTKQLDAETGMNYYGYRFYAANAGRWINRDPIGENGGANIYGMIENNSIILLDALGLDISGNAKIKSIDKNFPNTETSVYNSDVDVCSWHTDGAVAEIANDKRSITIYPTAKSNAKGDVTITAHNTDGTTSTKNITVVIPYSLTRTLKKTARTSLAVVQVGVQFTVRIDDQFGDPLDGVGVSESFTRSGWGRVNPITSSAGSGTTNASGEIEDTMITYFWGTTTLGVMNYESLQQTITVGNYSASPIGTTINASGTWSGNMFMIFK